MRIYDKRIFHRNTDCQHFILTRLCCYFEADSNPVNTRVSRWFCQRTDTLQIYLGGNLFGRPVMEALWLINHSLGGGASAESWFLAFRREGDYSKHIFWVLLCGPHIINSPVIAFRLLWGNRAKGYDITQHLPIIKFYQQESTGGLLGSVKLVWTTFSITNSPPVRSQQCPKVRRMLFVTLDAWHCARHKCRIGAICPWGVGAEISHLKWKLPETEIQKSLSILKAHHFLSALQKLGKSVLKQTAAKNQAQSNRH